MPTMPTKTKIKKQQTALAVAPRAKSKEPRVKVTQQSRKPDPDRADAAVEVLQAVWLSKQHFNLEHKVGYPPLVREDSEGHLWVTVELHVPALDVDAWLDGTHLDHPDNQPDADGEQDDA